MQVSGSGTRVGQGAEVGFSNFGSLKSTETFVNDILTLESYHSFSNFGSLKSTETCSEADGRYAASPIQQFRLVEEH